MHRRALLGPQFLRGPESGEGGGGGGAQQGADDIAAVRALVAAEKARADSASAELAKIKDANAAATKAEEARKKKEADDQLDAKAKLELALKEGDANKARIAAFEKRMTDRADAQLKALPEKQREQLAKFRDKVGLDVFAEMVEDASAGAGHAVPPPPGGGGGMMGDGAGAPGLHKSSQSAIDMLTDMGAFGAIDRLKSLESVPNPDRPHERIFRVPVREFFKSMGRYVSNNASRNR